MDIFVAFGLRGNQSCGTFCNVQGDKSADWPNRDKCRHCVVSGHFARCCPNPWGSERSRNTGVAPKGRGGFRLFHRRLALGRWNLPLRLLLQSAPRGLIVLWRMFVIPTWTVVVFSPGSLMTRTAY